jgi:hypothetical protein
MVVFDHSLAPNSSPKPFDGDAVLVTRNAGTQTASCKVMLAPTACTAPAPGATGAALGRASAQSVQSTRAALASGAGYLAAVAAGDPGRALKPKVGASR